MPTRGLAYCSAVKRKTCRRRLLHVESLLVLFVGAFVTASTGAVVAQTPSATAPAGKTTRVPQPSRPSWNELTSAQREALSPLAGMWETLEPDRKKKWLEMAGRFPRLTPDAQKHMHERMGQYARLTPEQRATARENFRQAYELPADQRQEKLQRYQALPDEKKRALTEQAAKKQAGQAPSPPAPATAPPAPAPAPDAK
jgi:Protein of unknown function (DUF3106)